MTTITTEPATTGQTWRQVGRLWVPGNPRPQPRHRCTVRLAGSVAAIRRSRTPQDVLALVRGQAYQQSDDPRTPVGEWKFQVKTQARLMAPAHALQGPLRADVTIITPRPQRLDARRYPDGMIFHDVRGDRDNYDKLVLDAMTDAGWWHDDGQVCSGTIEKFYAAKGGSPGVEVVVWCIDEQPALLGGAA